MTAVAPVPSSASLDAASSAREEAAARTLADRLGLQFHDVTSFAPDPQILQSVPVDLMFRYNFLPYREEQGRLVSVEGSRPRWGRPRRSPRP